ncbi:MAG: DUF177 domain-containing protein [Deltaproteobacteria bacterium]|nr:DUF177 domain-containing protein [Deltaproteobacteria bacterium]
MLGLYDLHRLPEEGETIEEPLDREWLERALNDDSADGVRLLARAPGRARLTLTRIDPDAPGDPVIRVESAISADLSTPCVRCLSDVQLQISNTGDTTLFPARPPAAATEGADAQLKTQPKKGGRSRPKVELKHQELDEVTYEGHEIDLAALVREALLLEVPMNPSCADEDACADRTRALIHEAGAEGFGEHGDPRWAALRDLRDQLGAAKKASN